MRDHNFFDSYARENQTIPQGYVDIPEGRVLLADSEEAIIEDGLMFYRTSYAVMRNSLEFAEHINFEFGQSGGSLYEQEYRLNEAVERARTVMAELIKAGFYDDGRKAEFSSIN